MMLIFAALLSMTPQALRAEGAPGLKAIQGSALSAHIRFLADDLLEGRGTATRGHALAARYLATQLAALGVAPGAAGDSFFQPVPLRAFNLDEKGSSLTFAARGQSWPLAGKEVIFANAGPSGNVDVSAPLAFAGYGIVQPRVGYDDVGDVRGRIAIILDDAPAVGAAGIGSTSEAAVRSATSEKVRLLIERGALAVIVVRGESGE